MDTYQFCICKFIIICTAWIVNIFSDIAPEKYIKLLKTTICH